MRNSVLVLNILIIFSGLVKDLSGNNRFYFEKISPEAGFAFDAIYAISEDCNGFVWFGCNNGLYFYNTNKIEKVSLLPEEKGVSQSIRILSVLHDSNCGLWVATEQGLFKRNIESNTFERLVYYTKDSLFNTEKLVQQILQFDDELFLIIIRGQLFYFSIDEGILHEIKTNTKDGYKVTYVGMDSHQNILIGTNMGHVFKGDHPFKTFELFYFNESHNVTTICDDNNKYYIGYNVNGVDVVNNIGEKISEIKQKKTNEIYLPDNRVREIIKTDDGSIWIGTNQGIVVVDDEGSSIITNSVYNGLPHKSIYVLEKGQNGGIWVGTWSGGIAYYHKAISRFNHVISVPSEKETKSVISSFFEDVNGNVWIGSEQSGLSIYNINNGSFMSALPSELDKLPTKIKSIVKIDNSRVAIGTFSDGIWTYDQNLRKLTNITQGTNLENSIIPTLEATPDELWIGPRTRHSLYRYDFNTQKFDYYDFGSETHERRFLWVWKIMFDSSLRLWVCTEEGLYYKYRNDTTFQKCFENDTVYGLDKTTIYTIYEDNDEKIWIGTKGKGLFSFNPVTNQLAEIKFGSYQGGVDIFGIASDKQNNIWFSTNIGVFELQKENKNITRYSTVDGLPGDQFNPNSILRISTGDIFFGSSNGFSYINPSTIRFNDKRPKVRLSKLLVNNQSFDANDNIKSNTKIVSEIDKIVLSNKDNSLTFGVAANNFIKSHKNRFRYKLNGYDNDWIEIDQNKEFSYTKIPPGRYTLEVYGSNNDNVWSEEPLKIDIDIKYPIWQRWYALLVYLVVIQIAILIVFKEITFRFNLKREILAERFKSDAQEQLYAEKMKFFTNISHEFRTPLTLVISPLENLLRRFKYEDDTFQQLQTIKRNSSRLLRLTNQILDYRLLEVNKLKAKYEKSDIVKICNEVVQCFDFHVKEKQINLIFSSAFKELFIQVDPDMIEKIIYNILSNAIKFSDDKGQIFVSIERCEGNVEIPEEFICAGKKIEGPRVEIKVRDFGKGIKKEILPKIIERFSTAPNVGETGTGIGLHLSQEYAMLHDGNITFASEEGKGSIFILNIPFKEDVVFKEKSFVKQLTFEENKIIRTEPVEREFVKSSKAVVLLAEDNDELRVYLKNYLQQYFKVVTAKNGQQAYEIALEVIPDVIITDIMMPHTDGIEMTQKLKSNKDTNHIPVIVLTALSEVEYQKESLLKGVESYLTKPVDETLLLAQIDNILNKRALIEKRFSEGSDMKNQITGSATLIERAEKIVEKNLQNISFDMNMLLEELNVSRSTFHRKIKNSTSQSPSEFIRDIRLKYAIKLMKSGNYNIDEIGSYVGFNSTSYFIRSFKKKYAKTPNEYYKDIK